MPAPSGPAPLDTFAYEPSDAVALPAHLAGCTLCPRLVAHREEVAREKRRAYRDQPYWGRPVPGFGDVRARIVLLGLAPGAHGSNRTGRMFTGDASGDFLYPSLYRTGFASQPEATHKRDGLELRDVWITSAARCVPPGNRPTREEVITCRRWLERDFGFLTEARLVVALGSIGHDAYLELLRSQGVRLTKNRFPFGHGRLHRPPGGLPLLDTFHPSFQNTNTGKLTPQMMDEIFLQAREIAGATERPAG